MNLLKILIVGLIGTGIALTGAQQGHGLEAAALRPAPGAGDGISLEDVFPMCVDKCFHAGFITKERTTSRTAYCFARMLRPAYTLEKGYCSRYACSNGIGYVQRPYRDEGDCSVSIVTETVPMCPRGDCIYVE